MGTLGLLAFLLDRGQKGREASIERHAPPVTELPSEPSALTAPAIEVPETSRSVPADIPGHALLRGRVVSTDGAPIAGARVRWVAFRREEVELDLAWRQEDWGVLSSAFEERESDADGRFAFDARPDEAGHGSALIAVHPGHVAAGYSLAAEPAVWPTSVEIVLEPGAPVDVRVVDDSGRPVAGARVQHHGLAGEVEARGDPDSILPRLQFEEALTDEDGRARMARFPGEQAFQAFRGSSISPPWRGADPQVVELVLGDAFFLAGTATMPAWDAGFVGERRILISARNRHVWKTVGAVRSVPDGAFGPVAVPLGDAMQFRIRLEGSPIMPLEREFARPEAGATVRFDLAPERGEALWFEVTDEQGRPVPNSIGEATWEDPESPGHFRSLRMGGKPNGLLSLWSFPPGNIAYRVWAPGVGSAEGSADVPTEYGLQVVLTRGGTLEGRCTHEGEPVTDFVVSTWRSGPVQVPVHRTFVGRADGRFRLEDVSAGEWLVTACSGEFPSAEVQPIAIEARRTSEVEIELPTALVGRGRVIRASSGSRADALSDALVQPFSAGSIGRTAPWGPEHAVQPDGRFEVAAFVEGTNYLTVCAPGFAPREVEAVARAGEVLDWGDIALHATQRLRVTLVGASGSASAFTASAFGPTPLVRRPFSADGVVEYDGVGPGRFQFFAERASDDWTRMMLELQPGEDWNFECPVGGAASLRVRIVTPDETPLNFTPGVVVAHQDVSGVWMLHYRTAPGLEAVFEGLRCTDAKVSAYDPTSQPVATAQAVLVPGEENVVELRLGEAPLRIRVVDPAGSPVDSAWVIAREGGTIFSSDDTDGSGWADLGGVPQRTVLVDVSHRVLGRRIGVPVDASAREGEVVLEAEGALELRVMDGGEPLSEVSVALEVAPGLPLGAPSRTAASGRVAFEPLGPGDYRFALRRSDCWPVDWTRALDGGERVDEVVSMRRLASVDLTVVTSEGALVAQQDVELHCVELDADVREWLAAGRIHAPEGLRTSATGRIRLEGLPHGEYRWSAATASGTFVLLPGEPNAFSIALR